MWQQSIWVLLLAIWGTLCEMAPYLLFGFLVAGLLSVFVSPEAVERHLGGRGLRPVCPCTHAHPDGHAMISGLMNNASGIILLALLAWAYLGKCRMSKEDAAAECRGYSRNRFGM